MMLRDPFRGRKRRTVAASVAAIGAMLALVVYSPTLYRMFCETTGYNGTTQRGGEVPAKPSERVIVIRFTAETDPALPWLFAPVQREIRVKVGEQHLAHYVAENKTGEAVTGRAIFNVAPDTVGQYFNKIACFCFEEQTLAPHQRADMPVSFFIDPKILEDRNYDAVTTITLSYTFYRAGDEKRAEKPAPARTNTPN
jgi:cytochrome c oxidase assembly protein subunit 11